MRTIFVDANISTEVDVDGILIATIDMPNRSMNVFSNDLMDSLESLLDEAQSRTEVRAIVLMSGKSTFLVGADLTMVRQYIESAERASHEELHSMCGRLSRLYRRLETSGKPFVAAVNGLALGGGFELVLACHGRVLSNDASTKVGVPEVK